MGKEWNGQMNLNLVRFSMVGQSPRIVGTVPTRTVLLLSFSEVKMNYLWRIHGNLFRSISIFSKTLIHFWLIQMYKICMETKSDKDIGNRFMFCSSTAGPFYVTFI